MGRNKVLVVGIEGERGNPQEGSQVREAPDCANVSSSARDHLRLQIEIVAGLGEIGEWAGYASIQGHVDVLVGLEAGVKRHNLSTSPKSSD